MNKYVCSICGYVYDEAAGNPEAGVAPGTKWEDVPEDWCCPLCGASKGDFQEQEEGNTPPAQEVSAENESPDQMREMSLGEISALCSNLAKACDKQYLAEEAGLFGQFAAYYESKVAPVEEKELGALLALIEQDLGSGYSTANSVAGNNVDRGALRALVWGEKVTRILNSLIKRYETQQDALLENTKVYVCEVCGFVYIGDSPPDVCPVCKVPNMKITQVQRRS